jgi:hypothetical protein
MADLLAKHRVIGIRHALKALRDAGLISDGVNYPEDAVIELSKTLKKADNAKRHRVARKDASVPTLIKTIEATFNMPTGSVAVHYPTGRRAGANATAGSVRKRWIKANSTK